MSNNDSQKDGALPDGGQIARQIDVKDPACTCGSRRFGSFSLASPSCTDPGAASIPVAGNGPDSAGCSRR